MHVRIFIEIGLIPGLGGQFLDRGLGGGLTGGHEAFQPDSDPCLPFARPP